MPWGTRTGRRAGSRPAAFGVVLLAALLLVPAPGRGAEKSASVSLAVEAGRWSATRLQSLPEGGSLTLEMTVDGAVELLLLSQQDYGKFPKPERPLFRGRTEDSLSFSVVLPAAGDYYVLVDNREGQSKRSFKLAVHAATADHGRAKGKDVASQLREVERKLRSVFVFDELEIRMTRCGTADPGAGSKDRVVVCSDLARRLFAETGSKQRTQDAMLFTLMHSVGRVLLETWNRPLAGDPDLADEFATVLMILFQRPERARRHAAYFAAQPSPAASAAQPAPGQPLGPRRARNILRWLDDPNLLRRWQAVLLPHMQTEVLRRFERRPPAWADPELIARELAKR